MDNIKSNQKFKTGDTVQLKSGGPIMTVDGTTDKGEIYCRWFTEEHDKVYHNYFKPNSLKLFVK